MCLNCHPLKKYEAITSKEELNQAKLHALSYVEEGHIEVTNEIESTNYNEIQFYCNECGTKHVLWLHTDFLSHGGEWRTIKSASKVC